MTPRAVDVLAQVHCIYAEDTRRTGALLSHFGVRKELRAYHAHSDPALTTALIERLKHGDSLALVSDAGMPAISDPGAELCDAAHRAGIKVIALAGPSSVTTAVAAASLRGEGFRFVGFLVRQGNKRTEQLARLRFDPSVTVLFESPHRLVETLSDLQATLGPQRRVAVCREITKLHEETVRGDLRDVHATFAERNEILGEVVIVVEGALEGDDARESVDVAAWIQQGFADGMSAKDMARHLHEHYGVPRKEAYQQILELDPKRGTRR